MVSKELWVYADYNALFGEFLCISHSESAPDEKGKPVVLTAGMHLTAYQDDEDDHGNPDRLIATGTVEPSPHDLLCKGSRWVLRIDKNGVRHESELRRGL